jgi:hypothetical protein
VVENNFFSRKWKYLSLVLIGIVVTSIASVVFLVPQQLQTTFFGEQVSISTALIPEAHGAGALTNVFALPTDNIFSSKSYYTIVFTTATTGSIRTVDMRFPSGFDISSAKLIEVQGIGSGSLSVSGQVVKYTVTSPVPITAPKAIKIMMAGITNAATISNQVTVSTIDNNNINIVILDGPTNSAPFTLTPVKNTMIDNLAVTSPKMADNSITSSKIQDGQVATSDVASGAITSNKLDNNSVNTVCDQGICTSKLADNAVVSSKIEPGAVRPQVTPRFGSVITIPAGGSFASGVGGCGVDELIVGGGYKSESGRINMLESYLSPANTWVLTLRNSDTVPHTVQMQAVCLKLIP